MNKLLNALSKIQVSFAGNLSHATEKIILKSLKKFCSYEENFKFKLSKFTRFPIPWPRLDIPSSVKLGSLQTNYQKLYKLSINHWKLRLRLFKFNNFPILCPKSDIT